MAEKIIRKLDDNLIIRHASLEDAEALAKFNVEIHKEGEWDAKSLEHWTLDLISGEGPTFDTEDFTIVEDTQTGEIVSSCCLISQTWSYEGIPFKVGRPELVGTKKDYRRRGLVRQQFEIMHEWSSARGELAQAITGIPYYYRQFGYEMTLNLGGGRAGYAIHVPQLKEEEEESFTFRLADESDIPFLMKTYESGLSRSMITAMWDKALWRYEITGKRRYNTNRKEIFVIEDQQGNPAGMVGISPIMWGKMSSATLYELAPGYAWTEVTPCVIRFLWKTGEQLAKEQNQQQEIFGFWLGEIHPAYEVAATKLPRIRKPYAYFMRVPDLPALLETIKPVLERRLAESAFANHTGELKINFYRGGLRLNIERGLIETIESLPFNDLESCAASFPDLTFLHLVFGYRTMGELKHAFTDCSTRDDETEHLLDALFPKKPSDIWPVS
ncbi:MAG: GNAT family N-acetyltransferase [Brevefilum sp.]